MVDTGGSGIRAPERKAFRWVTGVLLGAYPVLIYIFITRWGVRQAGLLMLAVMALTYGRRLLSQRAAARAVAVQIAGIGSIIALSVILNDPRYMMQVPVLISVFLLIQFAWSFRRPPVMVERFARALQGDLLPEEIPYCRRVTVVWIVFFAVNAAVAEWTVWTGSPKIWAFYNGFLAYVIIGSVFAVEYIVRRVRFRRFGDGWIDRILKACLPKERGTGA